MDLVKLEITVTKEEARAIGAKLLDGVDIANVSPTDAMVAVGLGFTTSGSGTGAGLGSAFAEVRSAAAQNYLAAD